MSNRANQPLLTRAEWAGTIAGIAGAAMVAGNVGYVRTGFALFLVCSTFWAVTGWVRRNYPQVVLQVSFTAINIIGIYRWS